MTRRRTDVVFDLRLRAETEALARRVHELCRAEVTPPAVYSKKCESCSLYDRCLPRIGPKRSVRQYVARALKESFRRGGGAGVKQLLNTLYVTTQGAYLGQDGEAVAVRMEKETRLRVPLHTLSSIICFGQMSCSPFLIGYVRRERRRAGVPDGARAVSGSGTGSGFGQCTGAA